MTYTPDLAADAAEALAPAFTGSLETAYAAGLLAPLVPIADALLDTRGALWGVFAGTITDPRMLGWAAQFAGFNPHGASETDLRNPVVLRGHWLRATPDALIASIKATLTGTKTVVRRTRYLASDPTGDHFYNLQIRTRTSETPDPAKTLAAANKHKRAAVVIDFATLAGEDWQQVVDDNATWTSLIARYATWTAVINEPLA